MEATWKFKLEDGEHTVRTEISPWTGQISSSFDGTTIKSSIAFIMVGEVQRFDVRGHSFSVHLKGMGLLGHLELSLDGQVVDSTAGVATVPQQAAPPHAAPPPFLQPMQELNATDTEEILGTEEYPLDNTYGEAPFSTVREVSKESTNELTVEVDKQLGGGINLELLSALKADLSAQISKKVESKAGSTVTEKQTLTFSVPEHQSVVYQVIWKRKVRSAQYVYNINGNTVTVPYRMNYGLSCEVRTRPMATKAG